MGDHEDDDLKMAMRLSMEHESPEKKRSKAEENAFGVGGTSQESPEVRNRREQRELMAAAAEKRMSSKKILPFMVEPAALAVAAEKPGGSSWTISTPESKDKQLNLSRNGEKRANLGEELSLLDAQKLFYMIFGDAVTPDVLSQWSKQGIRFSPDPETSMGLVQHEGGPCGVLAAIQAFVLKYLLFSPEEVASGTSSGGDVCVPVDIFSSLTEEKRSRALVRSMYEILFMCGNHQRAVVATLSILEDDVEVSDATSKDEVLAKLLEGVSIDSGYDLHKYLRVNVYTSESSAYQRLQEMLPVFGSRMGAMLFLISALLSRGLDYVQADRDDPSQPLVTAPFGHASQEIVNLLLCGNAVANVFDGRMDLGGGMFVNGVSTNVEVGFLTLLEYLNFCKVGDFLKSPRWPIWVVGSESHYTVLFALDTKVQEENELEGRDTEIRKAFDAQDQSGGGGFISVEGLYQVLTQASITLPTEKLEQLRNTGFIVWNDFWQMLLDLDKSLGGLKDSSGLMGTKVFDLYHFNGIAKSVPGGEIPMQRPRLTKVRVSVPPKWTTEGYLADVAAASTISLSNDNAASGGEVSKPETPAQHAPLVDCIRTRWPRAICAWEGDVPSIV